MHDYRRRIQIILNKIVSADMKVGITQGFKLIREREFRGCYESEWRVPIHKSHKDVKGVVDALYASCGCPVEVEDYAGKVIVRVCPKDMPSLIPFQMAMLDKLRPMELLIGFDRMGYRRTFKWEHPHCLIGGETGMGKTDLLRLIIYTLLKNSNVDIDIIDLKTMSFLPFQNIPRVRIAYDIEEATELLEENEKTMKERVNYILTAGNRKHNPYRKKVIIIDEAAEAAPKQFTDKDEKNLAKRFEKAVSSLARLGREPGFHIIYTTQYPTAEIVNPQIKINCGFRVCFYVETAINSNVILDSEGAEKLNGKKGRILMKLHGLHNLQVPFVGDDDKWYQLLTPFKTEVITGGSSTRKNRARTTFDADTKSAHVYNEPHIESNGFYLSTKKGVEVPEKVGAKEIIGEQPVTFHRKSISINRQRKRTVQSTIEDSVLEEY